MSLSESFAAKVGRPELSRSVLRVLPQGATTSARDPGIVSAGATANVGSASAGVMLDSGRLSALFLGGIVVALAAFQWWTRGHQA